MKKTPNPQDLNLPGSEKPDKPDSANLPADFPPEKKHSRKKVPTRHPTQVQLPTLPDSIFATLPELLQKVVAPADSKEERDVLLSGAITVMSSILPNFFGLYDGKKVESNLYLFVTAKASAGKGKLVHCKQLVQPVHDSLRLQAKLMKEQFDHDLRKYNRRRAKNTGLKKPALPPELMLIIPANNSATGMFQLLAENGGRGLLFETEGDTLAQAIKADHGKFSDGLRKIFHNESLNYYRRTEREFVEILLPYLSALLSGTPRQVGTLIPDAENGLFSRFLFYYMNLQSGWKDVFAANKDQGLDAYYNKLGQEAFNLYKTLNHHSEIEFYLTKEQQTQFNAFFSQIHEQYLLLQGEDYMATVRRLGLIAYRIAMVFTALRMLESGDFSSLQQCSEVDFQAALSMISVFVKHSSHVFSELLKDRKKAKEETKSEMLLSHLPLKFSSREFAEAAKNLTIPKRTAELYISSYCERGLVCRVKKGAYTNLTLLDNYNAKRRE